MDEITSAARNLIIFTKSHGYPEPNSEDFHRLTNLLDRVETELRLRGYLPRTGSIFKDDEPK